MSTTKEIYGFAKPLMLGWVENIIFRLSKPQARLIRPNLF